MWRPLPGRGCEEAVLRRLHRARRILEAHLRACCFAPFPGRLSAPGCGLPPVVRLPGLAARPPRPRSSAQRSRIKRGAGTTEYRGPSRGPRRRADPSSDKGATREPAARQRCPWVDDPRCGVRSEGEPRQGTQATTEH
ncbi:hypothetical protein NDU88_002409 [Pleurodeles waltl]|uniref:Uncharacterized protein n=1 Tax=Pleurodeles waltl TaxID=8319 RepID=A0AAV7NN22_PLEWA|nr:hypothetical protein NDU88_002409 [Pleurodeles waltl]